MLLSRATFLLLSLLLLGIGCGTEDPDVDPPEELITTLNYTLTPMDGSPSVTMTFSDLDGEGGNAASITGGTLSANAIYSATIELLNESTDPTEDITAEIKEEDAEHQFFFTSTIPGLRIDYSDTDDDGRPVGLSSTVVTGAEGSGTITIILRHEPNKSADGVSTGDISNAGGETDIEVTFSVDVQ